MKNERNSKECAIGFVWAAKDRVKKKLIVKNCIENKNI